MDEEEWNFWMGPAVEDERIEAAEREQQQGEHMGVAPAIVYDATSMPEPLPCALPLPRDPATLQSVTATDTMQVRIFTRRQKGFLVEFYNRCTSTP